MKILLVDDDPEIAVVVEYALARVAGHELVVAETGAEALAKAGAEPFDAVLLDVMLPDADGAALVAPLRALAGTARAPIVFLTGKSNPETDRALVAAGARGVLAKPFDPFALADDVARLVAPEAA